MELTIKLKKSFGRLASREPFIITSANNEEYFLNLDADTLIKKCIAVFRKGQHSAEVHAEEPLGEVKQIRIPDEFVQEGAVECEIQVISHGVTVAKYHVEPIVFARVDTHFEGHPEIEELRQLVKRQGELIEAQNEVIGGLETRLQLAEQKVNEIWANEEM